jgi:hypothetical protein
MGDKHKHGDLLNRYLATKLCGTVCLMLTVIAKWQTSDTGRR